MGKVGRPKGSKNQVSVENREALSKVLQQYRDSATMQEDIALVSPKERLDFMLKIHGLTAPKLTSADVTVSTTPHPYIGKPVYLTDEERLEIGLPPNDEEE
tara:strand:- start:18 stop:320 length:303 start_codon:yes stop_codon:yes gene_type:complete